MATNSAANTPTGAAGTVLQGQGAGSALALSTATYPSTASSTGTILRANGTNWVATTATYPTTTTAYNLVCSTATNVVGQIAAASTGTVLTGVTGAVPAFSATPSITSISFDGGSNNLSAYSEGTFTPTAVGGSTAGAGTYTIQIGRYIKVGNFVTINYQILWSAHTGTGEARLSSMPFTVKTLTNYAPTGGGYYLNVATYNPWSYQSFSNLSYTIGIGVGASGSTQIVNATNAHYFTLTYTV